MKKLAIIGMVLAGLMLSTASAWATPTGMTKAEYRALMLRSEGLNQRYGLYKYSQPALVAGKLGEVGSWAVQSTPRQTVANPTVSQQLEEIGAWAVPSKQTAETPLVSEKLSGLGLSEPTTTLASSGEGFDWNDAGIGAALAFGAVLVGVATLMTVRHQHRPIPH
ncbi:MAG: hypothetical protein ACJ75Q_07100 [Gaiellaceae bacterium]